MDGPNALRPDEIAWCPECGKYYNPKAPHECVTKEINEAHTRLEQWLGRFKIKKD